MVPCHNSAAFIAQEWLNLSTVGIQFVPAFWALNNCVPASRKIQFVTPKFQIFPSHKNMTFLTMLSKTGSFPTWQTTSVGAGQP
jgi:hypothetical protein